MNVNSENYQRKTYKLQKINFKCSFPKPISNYTTSIIFDYSINVILPNSVKHISNHISSYNLYPNSITNNVCKHKHKNKFNYNYNNKNININITNYKFKYVTSVINVHTLGIYTLKKCIFLNTIHNLKINGFLNRNISKMITNNTHNITLNRCDHVKNILKLRNTYMLHINDCYKIIGDLIINNVYSLTYVYNPCAKIMCYAYKIKICYDDECYNDYNDYNYYNNSNNNGNKNIYYNFNKYFTCIFVLRNIHKNITDLTNICYAKKLVLRECVKIDIRKLVNVSNLKIVNNDYDKARNIINIICFNKIHTLFLSDINLKMNKDINNISNLNVIHSLTLDYIDGITDVSNMRNMYELYIENDEFDIECMTNKFALNTVKKLTICKNNY